MTDGIRPVGGTNAPSIYDRREGDRRGRDRRQDDDQEASSSPPRSESRELIALTHDYDEAPAKPAAPPPVPPAAFSAQIMGQTGQKRGLKGGPAVLDAARETYLGTEYSGKNDRRPKPGCGSKTEI